MGVRKTHRSSMNGWHFAIDVGGTFTDCIAHRPDGTLVTHKLLSTGAYRVPVRIADDGRSAELARPEAFPNSFLTGFRVEGDGLRRVQITAHAGASIHISEPLASAAGGPALGGVWRQSSRQSKSFR